MNQEKEMKQVLGSASEYFAPRVKVVEVKAMRRICAASSNEPNEYAGYDWDTDE